MREWVSIPTDSIDVRSKLCNHQVINETFKYRSGMHNEQSRYVFTCGQGNHFLVIHYTTTYFRQLIHRLM